MKLSFLLIFLVAFATLTVFNEATALPQAWGRALEAAGSAVSPAITGWSFERTAGGDRNQFRRGAETLLFQINLEMLARGLLPLLSLFAATTAMPWQRRLGAAAIATIGLFLLDLIVLLAYPWMVRNPNAAKDITGTFLGMLIFVGGPIILWFALSYRDMRQVWSLDLPDD